MARADNMSLVFSKNLQLMMLRMHIDKLFLSPTVQFYGKICK